MQNRYVADVGDFGKYGLLRALLEMSKFKLGVVWWLTPDEQHNEDGRHTTYLNPSKEKKFRCCDDELYDQLKTIFFEKQRNIKAIELAKILPGAMFYGKFLGRTDRGEWISGALKAITRCNLIFLDPDNGITMGNATSPKHVTLRELTKFYGNGKRTLVVYHHLCRRGTHEEQMKDWASKIQKYLGVNSIPLRFRRGTSRAFFIIPGYHHRNQCLAAVKKLLENSWGENGHFSRTK